jgi:undecaprenyl diphosphate synthase
LTLYSFSTENWKRPAAEVAALMALLKSFVLSERKELMDQGIQVRVIGEVQRLPLFVRKPLKMLCNDSEKNIGMVLNLALSYGSRAEIVQAVRSVARDAIAGKVDPDSITEAVINDRLYTRGLPDPDLLIWQLAYTEIYVADTYWPDFREAGLNLAFEAYAQRRRRFGKTDAQIGKE